MYRSDCDDFLVFEDNGFTQPPSSSGGKGRIDKFREIERQGDASTIELYYSHNSHSAEFSRCFVLHIRNSIRRTNEKLHVIEIR